MYRLTYSVALNLSPTYLLFFFHTFIGQTAFGWDWNLDTGVFFLGNGRGKEGGQYYLFKEEGKGGTFGVCALSFYLEYWVFFLFPGRGKLEWG